MIEKVITDNSVEKITVKWDGERFAIVRFRVVEWSHLTDTVILNPKEMMTLIEFAGTLGED